MPKVVIETRIAARAEACFSLSLSVDAHSASMSASKERAIAGVTSGEMGPGDSVTWRARHFGIPIRLTSIIRDYEPPTRFVDEQVRGPFKRWWHEHRFVEDSEGTLMTDVIELEAPFGPLGRLVEWVGLTRYMRSLILTRNAWLKEQLAGSTW